jgi:hypothetical protein
MDGFKGLGELVVGLGRGTDNTSPAYVGGMREGYAVQSDGFRRDKLREEARRARAMAIARDAIPDAVRTAGYAENVRPLVGAILQGNPTMDVDQLGDLAVPGAAGAYAAAETKLRDGDVAGYNDELAIATGKERKPYSLAAGGRATFRADTGATELTDLGDAALASENALKLAREATAAASAARARANDAAAGANEASADLRRRTDPNRPRTAPPKAAGSSNPAVADSTPPVQGARKAPDGFWYVPDPARPGKWLRVDGDR